VEWVATFSGLRNLNVAGSAIYDINGHISSAVSLIGMACDTDITSGSPLRQQLITCVQKVTDEICGQPQLKRHA